MPYTQNGVTVWQPQAIVTLDESALEAGNNINDIVIGIVGTSDGGQPGVPLTFTTARDARKRLVGGILPQAIERMYNPGVQPGAYRVVAVRLNGDSTISGNLALQAILNVKDAGGTANGYKLTAVDYGILGNEIAVEVLAPTTSGEGHNVIVYVNGLEIEGVDVTLKGLTIDYTGTGTVATVAVSATALTTVVTDGTDPITGDQVNLLFSTYDTIGKLVDALNATGKYTASVAGFNPNALSTTLDKKSATSCLTALTLRGDLQAIVDWFNQSVGEFLTAEKLGTATTTIGNVAKTHLASGRDPIITNASWAEALDVLGGVDCQIVTCTSGDATIHAMIQAHVNEMSTAENKRERLAIVGAVAGETPSQTKVRAAALNDKRVQLAYPGIKDADGSTLAPYFLACQVAGISAGLKPGYAKTAKYVRASGVERTLDEGTVNDLEQSGIMVVKNVINKGVKIVHDQTTNRRDNNVVRREFSDMLTLDRVVRAVRDVAEARIGEPGTPASRNIIQGDIQAILTSLTQQGLLVGDATFPSYKNVSVRVVGEAAEVSFEIQIGSPLNYVGVVIKPTTYNGGAA